MKFNPAQEVAQQVLNSGARHVLLEGGSRSGKTFLLVRAVCARASKAPGSRHVILRFRFSHVKQSVVLDTFPTVMKLAVPWLEYELNKSDWYAQLSNGSEIWFGGLDDKARTEKILGREFATLYLNEISQIPFGAREIALTRLAQRATQRFQIGKGKIQVKDLPPRVFYDLNPTNRGHWGYKLFHEHRHPETGQALPDPENYRYSVLNPEDNRANLAPGYIENVLSSLSSRAQKRFLLGEWADENPNGLFSEADIDRWRVLDGQVPEMVRLVVGVDPSGASDESRGENDAIGIVVGGLGTDGRAYLLEDCTVNAGPGTWGQVVASAYDRHQADVVVAEKNFGGEMVRFVIDAARPRTHYRAVTASRGKAVRAEPFSALYEQGRVCHVGFFRDLEEELAGFSTAGYVGVRSPNRADAWIWVLSELFPAIVRAPARELAVETDEYDQYPAPRRVSWMG